MKSNSAQMGLEGITESLAGLLEASYHGAEQAIDATKTKNHNLAAGTLMEVEKQLKEGLALIEAFKVCRRYAS